MRNLLKLLYENEQMSQQKVAEALGVSQTTIRRWMGKLGVRTRQKEEYTGLLSPRWRGGRKINNGRIYHMIPDHPNADMYGYVEEGRLIIENIIGDFLPEGSVVHHFDEDPANNLPENVMYFSGHAPHTEYHYRKRKDEHIYHYIKEGGE